MRSRVVSALLSVLLLTVTNAAAAVPAVETIDGETIPGTVEETKPGEYAIVRRPDGTREAVDWSRIKRLDGAPPPSVPPPGLGSVVPAGFSPSSIQKLADGGMRASEALGGMRGGASTIAGIKETQGVLETVGLQRRKPPALFMAGPMTLMSSCFMVNYGNFNPAVALGPPCKYFFVPLSIAGLILGPFSSPKVEEEKGPTVHHLDLSIYALDYSKKSALTGQLRREPSGSFFGNNLGYDLGYTYIHPKYGLVAYGHGTLQQTTVAEASYVNVSNNFLKMDGQLGLDLVRLLSGGDPDSWWTQHTAFFRIGPSFFHDWVVMRDTSGKLTDRSYVKNPLNQSIGLVSALGYEIAAEVDFRFPAINGWSLGGVHLDFERGSYPSISFPDLNPRDAASVALVGFDDLRAGDTYTWQRFKAELELPLNWSRMGGLFLGGQLIRYENNFGTGVDNRGINISYRYRYL